MAGNIKEIDGSQFKQEVLNKERVVVDFYSTEYPPCEALASKYERLSELYGDDISFVKIFRQNNRELAVQLGVTSSPTLLFYNEGTETGIRLKGGIKQRDIMKNLDTMLPVKRVHAIKSNIQKKQSVFDVIILGGGPAGLTAGIYLAQAHIKTVIVDIAMPGGYVATTHTVSNYPGFPEPLHGYMLSHYMSEQAKAQGVFFRSAVDASNIDLQNKSIVIDEYETIQAKKIIIATGSSPKLLNIPGESEYIGKGLSYCATCDGKYYEDKDIVVIGGGNSAIEESLFLTKFAKSITIVHQFAELQANKIAQEKAFQNNKIHFMFLHEPREFISHGPMDMEVHIEDLQTGEMKSLRTNGVFIFAGFIPNLEMLTQTLNQDKWGYVITNDEMETNISGVYAIGDVKSKAFRQITTAVADGTIAAMAISKYFN